MAYHMYEREVGFYTRGPAADRRGGTEVLRRRDRADQRRLHRPAGGPVPPDAPATRWPGATPRRPSRSSTRVVPLHAKYWGHPEDMTVETVPRIDGENQSAGITAGCAAGWDPCMELFGHVVPDEIKAAKDRFLAGRAGDPQDGRAAGPDDHPRRRAPRQPDVRRRRDRPARLGAVGVHRAAGRRLPPQPERDSSTSAGRTRRSCSSTIGSRLAELRHRVPRRARSSRTTRSACCTRSATRSSSAARSTRPTPAARRSWSRWSSGQSATMMDHDILSLLPA